MARSATFEWHTPPPTSVDEVLALYDDGSAVLVLRRPRREGAAIGSYVAHPAADDARLLAAAGPGPVVFDLLAPPPDAAAALMAAADRVAKDGLATPRAVVTFHAHAAGPASGGTLGATLLAVAGGTVPVEFELDPRSSSVQFFDTGGQPLSWHDLPELPTGFMTSDAEGLGGVLRPAVVKPGAYGAIAFDTKPPAGAASVSILVAGWISDAFPDATDPERFQVRTAAAPIPG
jgi:hypothetical protein